MENKKLFNPDFDKSKFDIIIEIKQNCNLFTIKSHDGYTPSYHEVVGALEMMKHNVIKDQSEHNKKSRNTK